MTKQVIVVVHGVGVKQAGISSDLLAAALQDGETYMRPHSSDDYVLLEKDDYDSSGKASVFPARMRRYRSLNDDGSIKHERVIADFYWGDVTAFGISVLNLVLAYFKVAMGLSHAIRENADAVYGKPDDPETDTIGRWIGKLARGAALTIHGPIIAFNVVLLLGLLLAAMAKLVFAGALSADNLLRLQILLVAAAAIGGGWFLLRRGGAFLYRHLLSWIVLSGVAFLVLGIPELIAGTEPLQFRGAEAVKWIDGKLTSFQCGAHANNETLLKECKSSYAGMFTIGLRLVAVMWGCWLLIFAQVIVLAVLGLVRRPKEDEPQVPNLIVPALSLMSLLWFLLIAALWAAVLKLPGKYNLDVPEKIVAAALNLISAAVIVLILLGGVAYLVLRRKRELAGARPEAYMENADTHANRYRLLIASGLLRVLWGFLPLVLAIVALVYIPGTGDVQRVLGEWTVTIIFALLAIGSFLVYSLKAEFAAGIGILADVLAYLNNASWKGDGASPTWLERLLFKGTNAANPHGYWLRRRIHDRLDVLVRSLVRDEKPDRLDIVSHSQGTMIAIDLIGDNGGDWLGTLREEHPKGEMRLVTMGSPYAHLYGNYFPNSFAPVEELDANKAVLSAWLNIFRIDDFVGTHIGKGEWPVEFPVAPNGHTNYWVDRGVVMKLREFLKL
jgi:hypothetical protein